MSTRQTIEITTGIHSSGATYVELHDLQWSIGWRDAADAPDPCPQGLQDEIDRGAAKIDRAEGRYYACSPEAREFASEGGEGSWDLPECREWEDEPAYRKAQADLAEQYDRLHNKRSV